MYVAKVGLEKSLADFVHNYKNVVTSLIDEDFLAYSQLINEKHVELESEVYTGYLYAVDRILFRFVQIFLDDPMGLELMKKMASSGMVCIYLQHKKLTSTNEIIEEVNRIKGELLLMKNSKFAVVIDKQNYVIGAMKIKIFEM